MALDGEGNRREFRLALTTRTTAENDDDDDEKDCEVGEAVFSLGSRFVGINRFVEF